MVRIYEEEPTFFGPPVITLMPAPVDQVDEEIRQNFASAVTSGSRSGSGKIVLEFFNQLKQIWGGSPSTEPLSIGVGTDDFTDSNENESTLDTQLASDDADVEGDNMLSSESESPSGSAGKKSFKGKKRVCFNPYQN